MQNFPLGERNDATKRAGAPTVAILFGKQGGSGQRRDLVLSSWFYLSQLVREREREREEKLLVDRSIRQGRR